MVRRSMMGLVRKGRRRGREDGFVVTWDIDSRDRRAADRVRHFVFGRRVRSRGRTYDYGGFVFQPGVRYVAQSALFVSPERKGQICAFLEALGVDHETLPAAIG